MTRGNCKSETCGAPIIWAVGPPTEKHPQGAPIPIDATAQPVYWPAINSAGVTPTEGLSSRPTPAYELVTAAGVTRAQPIGKFHIVRDESKVAAHDVRRLFVSHFATCPDAGKFSARNKDRKEQQS